MLSLSLVEPLRVRKGSFFLDFIALNLIETLVLMAVFALPKRFRFSPATVLEMDLKADGGR